MKAKDYDTYDLLSLFEVVESDYSRIKYIYVAPCEEKCNSPTFKQKLFEVYSQEWIQKKSVCI